MSGYWFLGRAGRDDLYRVGPDGQTDSSRADELVEWMRRLGVDPANISLDAVLTHDDALQHYLHLSEYVVDDKGRKQIDYAADAVYRRPVVVPVEPGSWPRWLHGLNRE